MTEQMIPETHKYGMKVIPWSVNDAPTMHRLIDDGTDGLITDYEVMEQRGLNLPNPNSEKLR
ncbi:glycerophosphodiester phosphodiesterase family protein [Bacillus sp. CGMCC 1.60114]|uniref:glycerophosphodiester phosphodiesterase family protein n=1 Tax=unclassified Bacillus (in: firmicutes) TaxID=185979 RepID=UPI0036305884